MTQKFNLESNQYWAFTNFVYYYATDTTAADFGWYTSTVTGLANASGNFWCNPH